ncbi:hypothetical protein K1X76_11795 [bacterium]|nr:hypothetical protein [bacterium]
MKATFVAAFAAAFLITYTSQAYEISFLPSMFKLSEPSPTLTTTDTNSDETETHATSVWLGFNHQWEKEPHRLSRLGSYLSKNELTDRKIVSQQNSVFRVGAFEDTGMVDMKARFVRSKDLKFYHGSISGKCLTVSGNMGELHSKSCQQTLDLDAIGMGDVDHVDVILRGFNVTAESYERGYNTMGFGVFLSMNNNVVKGTFKIKPQHEPLRPMADDGCNQDNHCTYYTYSTRIYYTVIGYNDGDAQITHGYNAYNEVVKMMPNKAAPYPSATKRAQIIEGDSGFPHGLVAMRGFEFFLDEWKATAKDGRYIREIEFNIDDVDYNAGSGIADFNTNMYFSNEGVWPYGFDATYKMWTSLIQFGKNDCELSESDWHSGELGEGEIEFKQNIEHLFTH